MSARISFIVSEAILFGVVFFLVGNSVELFFSVVREVAMLLVAIGFVAWWGLTSKHQTMIYGVTAIACFWLGGNMVQDALLWTESSPLVGRTLVGEGVVIDDPSVGQFHQNVFVQIRSCEEGIACRGERVLLEMDAWTRIAFGDSIDFSCTFQKPENFSEDFDWQKYLASKKIRTLCKDARVESVERSTFLGFLGSVRHALEESVNASIEQPYASLGNGLLFGGSKRMSEELADDFARTSMTHIVAVSGYNVSLIAGYVFSFAVFLGFWRRSATGVAVVAVLVFVLFIGAPSSAIRAGIMGGIVLFALLVGRVGVATRALLYAGVAMILVSPLITRYDTGFQLSVLATLGILTFSPLWERIRPSNAWVGGIGDILFMTLSAQLFVLPIILTTFGGFSALSVLTNLFVLPTLPIAMLLTFLSAISGLLWGPLGFLFGVGAQAVLWYDIFIVQTFARMDFGFVEFSLSGSWFVFLWYAIVGGLAVWVWWSERAQARRLCRTHRLSHAN